MSLTIKWDITYKCNLFCEHCVNGKYLIRDSNDSLVQELSFKDIQSIINNISSYTEIGYIHFLGGEPLVRQNFFQIADFLCSKNIYFGFNTNSLLLNDLTLQRLLPNPFLSEIIISLEGSNAKSNDKIRGKKVFDTAIKRINAINKLKKTNGYMTKVIINFVVTSKNFADIRNMMRLCDENEIHTLNLLQFINEGNAEGKDLEISPEQFLSAINSVADLYTNGTYKTLIVPKFARPMAKDFVKKCSAFNFPESSHMCGAGTSFIYINNVGDIFACDREKSSSLPYIKSHSLCKEDFAEIYKSTEFDVPFAMSYDYESLKNVHPCNRCKYLHERCFPCFLSIAKHSPNEMKECAMYVRLAETKGVDLLNV